MSDDPTTNHGLAVTAAKAAPPITVSSFSLAGVPLSDLVLLATLAYTLLQIHFLLKEKKVYSKIGTALKNKWKKVSKRA